MSPIFKSDNLGKYVRIRTGKLDANANDPYGDYPFFTCAAEPLRIATFSYDCECVLIAGNGDLNAKYYSGKFDAYQRTYIVESIDKNILDVRYLYYFLSTYMHKLREMSIGGVIKYIKLNYLTDVLVPLLPLPEQMRIADILDKADSIRHKRQEAVRLTEELLCSAFLDMFDDPESNSWPMTTIAGVAQPGNGAIRTGPFGSQLLHSEFVDKGIAVLGIDNAVANEFRWSERRFISEAKYRELSRYTVRPGDVIITIMGTCGRCAVVPDDIPVAINTKHLCCITLDQTKCLPAFVHAYFLQHHIARRYLDKTAKGAIMDGLNMGIIKDMPIPVPPLKLQHKFACSIAYIEQLRSSQRSALDEQNKLFNSLLQRSFKGDL